MLTLPKIFKNSTIHVRDLIYYEKSNVKDVATVFNMAAVSVINSICFRSFYPFYFLGLSQTLGFLTYN